MPLPTAAAATGYRNIQGLRAIAALMVFISHLFWDIPPMRTHWARPYLGNVGPAGVDIFFVISGFIISRVAQRSAAQAVITGRWRAARDFAIKRIVRIYPLYWIVFVVATLIALAVPVPPSFIRKPQLALLLLIDSIPNFRVNAAWTLTFEVYFYAVTTLSILVYPKRILAVLLGWFVIVGGATVLATAFGVPIPLDYVFAPILLEFSLGIVVGKLIERGRTRFPRSAIVIGALWIMLGAWALSQDGGRAAQSYVLRLVCWGLPAALVVYGVLALEVSERAIMPVRLQYLGDASYSIYLWHAVSFVGVAAIFNHLGWVGVIDRSLLAVAMGAIALAVGLLSYHVIERPLLHGRGREAIRVVQ